MIDLRFKAPDQATFVADIGAFCDEAGFPRFIVDGDLSHPYETGSTRIDFCVDPDLVAVPAALDANGDVVTPAITRGWHCRVTLSERDPRQPTGKHILVAAAIEAWFAAKPSRAHDTPQEVLDAFGLDAAPTVHVTERQSVLVRPEHPKEGRAGA